MKKLQSPTLTSHLIAFYQTVGYTEFGGNRGAQKSKLIGLGQPDARRSDTKSGGTQLEKSGNLSTPRI